MTGSEELQDFGDVDRAPRVCGLATLCAYAVLHAGDDLLAPVLQADRQRAPLAAVVTTPQIARSFVTGMEYFNTFGGNPVSCTVGHAVLGVIRDERLIANAAVVGSYLRAGLDELRQRHDCIGDVRGRGLFLGVDLVRDRSSREPATQRARAVIEAAVARGVLLSADGPGANVLKIKPPIVLTRQAADRALRALDEALVG